MSSPELGLAPCSHPVGLEGHTWGYFKFSIRCFNIWTISSQLDWRWIVSNGFNNSLENPLLFQTQLLSGVEVKLMFKIKLSLASSWILECLSPANQSVWVRRNFENFSDFPRNCQIVKGSLRKLVKNIHNGSGRRELSREISSPENNISGSGAQFTTHD